MKTGNWPSGATLMLLLTAALILPAASVDDHSRFIAENEASMARMMAAMNIKPTGDVDRDFAAMMIPHHQGAIDMAVSMLRYGRNEQLRRIAQEIIIEQQQEIDAMRLALGQPLQTAPVQILNNAGTTGAMHHHDPIRKEH